MNRSSILLAPSWNHQSGYPLDVHRLFQRSLKYVTSDRNSIKGQSARSWTATTRVVAADVRICCASLRLMRRIPAPELFEHPFIRHLIAVAADNAEQAWFRAELLEDLT